MRLIQLLVTFCVLVSTCSPLVSAQDESSSTDPAVSPSASASETVSSENVMIPPPHKVDDGKKIIIKKDIDVDAKDIIVNVGKVDIDIEIEKQEQHGHGLDLAGTDAGAAAEGAGSDGLLPGLVSPMDGHGSLSLFDHLKKIIIKKEIDVDAKDIIVNVGKVDIDIEIEKEKQHGHGLDVAGTDAAGADDVADAAADAEALDKKVVVHHDDGNKIIIKKEIDVDAKDIILNVGKVDVDVEVESGKGKLCTLFGKGC